MKVKIHHNVKPGMKLKFSGPGDVKLATTKGYVNVVEGPGGTLYRRPRLNKKERKAARRAASASACSQPSTFQTE